MKTNPVAATAGEYGPTGGARLGAEKANLVMVCPP
jgi:hypothetical protein